MQKSKIFSDEQIARAAKNQLGVQASSPEEIDKLFSSEVFESSQFSEKQKDSFLDELVSPFFV